MDEFIRITNLCDAVDKEDHEKDICRYQFSRKGVMEYMESKSSGTMEKYRALVDVRMGMLIRLLNLSNQVSKNAAMYCPGTDSRCLVSSKGVCRQHIHSDRVAISKKRTIVEKENLMYFTIATGGQPVYSWAVPGSHIAVTKIKAKNNFALSAASNVEKVQIPPYSIFIGRCDLPHAAAGGNDYLSFKTSQARIHRILFPAKYKFPNAISFVNDYLPNFAKDIDSDISASDIAPPSPSVDQEEGGRAEDEEMDNFISDDKDSPEARKGSKGQ